MYKKEFIEQLKEIRDELREVSKKNCDQLVEIAKYTTDGLLTDDKHHKQWYLEKIFETLGLNVELWREKLEWEEGTQP